MKAFKIETKEEWEEFKKLVPTDIGNYYGDTFPSSRLYFHYPSYSKTGLLYSPGCHIDSDVRSGYTKVSFEEWKDSITLPEKWCILPTKESTKEIAKFFNTRLNCTTYTGIIYNYIHSHDKWGKSIFTEVCELSVLSSKPREGFTEINIETFRKIIGKMKKIIGYKAPKDLFKGTIPKDTVYMPCSSETNPPIYIATKGGTVVDSGRTNLPAEIVEEWEPIYEAEKKVLVLGDPKRDFTIEKDSISVLDGDGTKRDFGRKALDAVLNFFNASTTEIGVDITINSLHIGCDAGTVLTKKEVELIKITQDNLWHNEKQNK